MQHRIRHSAGLGNRIGGDNVFTWSRYWAQHLFDQPDLNLWVKEDSRSGLTLTDSINPANSPTILPSYYKKLSTSSYAHVTDNGALDIGATDFTLWMRVRSETTGTTKQFLGGKLTDVGTSPDGTYGIIITATSNVVSALIYPTGGAKWVSSAVTFNSLGWCTLRMDVNQATLKLRFFINNIQIGADTAFTGTFPALNNMYRFFIGAGARIDNGAFTGSSISGHSDTFVLNRLMSTQEAINAEAGIYPTNCKAHWPCNDARNINDVSGNGYHLTMEGILGTNMITFYSASGSPQSMNKGYSLYTKLPDKPFYVPYLDAGTPIVTPSIPTNYIKIRDVAGSSANFNLSGALVRFAIGSQWDRSNATIFSASARAATTYYDITNPTDWHTSELNQDTIDYWLNTDYKDINFVKVLINSVNQRDVLKELFAYNNVKNGIDLKKILTYTTDYSEMFTHFTRAGAGLMMGSGSCPVTQYYNGKTYIVYQGNDDDPYIITYNHSTKLWATPVKIGVNPLVNGDNHGFPSILVDSTGYIHVFWGAHVTNVLYSKSTNPEDISAWTVMGSPTYGSYFQPIQFSDGTIYLFFRLENPLGGCKWGYKTSTNGGTSWNDYVDLFREFAYWSFKKGIGDVVHATSEGYLTSSNDRRNMYYARFIGGQWQKIDGTVLSPPIVLTVTDIKIYDSGTKTIVKSVPTCDANNIPYIAFADGVEATTGPYEYKIIKYNGATWDIVSLGISTVLNNNGVPIIIMGSGGYIEIYLIPNGNVGYHGGDLEKWTSDDYGNTWAKDSTVIYGNILVPSSVLNGHVNAKVIGGDYMAGNTTWVNKGYLLGDSGLIKNYKGSDW